MYDIFLVGKGKIDPDKWKSFKQRYPTAQKLEDVNTFEEVSKKSFTKFFWVVWNYIDVVDEWKFDYVIPKWDEQYIHVFKNGQYYDGICIFPKHSKILQKEWNHRFFTAKKEIDIVASHARPYDIVFISYNEDFADKNYDNLCVSLKKKVKRVHGIKGIHQAHIEAAKISDTEMFYVVDADAVISDDFSFDYTIPYYDFNAKNSVYVWKSKNPVNRLIYGYGGVKLLPKDLTINMDISKPDMTTSISKQFRPMDLISNVTAFNTDPFNSWKSAFRECCKLASRVIDRQDDAETEFRLNVWCEETTDLYALEGARAGRKYGTDNKTNLEALKMINDFQWLKERFDARQS
jgi:hypothetical protein